MSKNSVQAVQKKVNPFYDPRPKIRGMQRYRNFIIQRKAHSSKKTKQYITSEVKVQFSFLLTSFYRLSNQEISIAF